jgi:hypothetical protein
MGPDELRLPLGYWLDRSDPDLWTLRRPEGWAVAYFSALGAAREAIEQAAWEDYEGSGEEYPSRRPTTTYTTTEATGPRGASAGYGSTKRTVKPRW